MSEDDLPPLVGNGQCELHERTLRIVNARGLHARAAASLARLAQSFDAEITVSCEGQTVSADSVMDLLLLAAAPGMEITVQATGPDAPAALQAITTLVNTRFGEEE